MDAGYPDVVISSVCERMVRNVKHIKGKGGNTKSDEKRKSAVFPYIHRLAHGLKNIGSRYGVNVRFSVKHEIGRICSIIDNALTDKQVKGKCTVSHKNRCIACVKEVV